MATGNARQGQTVAATFEGPLRSDAALTALKEAGFRPEQVAVQVAQGDSAGAGNGDAGTGTRTIALIAGAVLGALVGAFLGRALVGSTLALVLGALVGALAGAAIAGAIARIGGSSAGSSSGTATTRPGSVTLTVTADSAAQVQQARGILAQRGGNVRP